MKPPQSEHESPSGEPTLIPDETLMRSLFCSIQDGILILDKNLKILSINPQVERLHGEKLPLVGSFCYEKIYDRETPCDFCPAVRSLRSGEMQRTITFDSVYQVWLELTGYPLFDQQTGEIIGATELIRDITKQHTAQENLKKNEALLRDIFSSIRDPIFIIDRDYNVLRTNKGMEDMYPEHFPLSGKKCFITSGLNEVCPVCPAKIMFHTGEFTLLEHYEDPAYGRPGKWLEHSAYPVLNPLTGGVEAAISIIRDITQRKENELALHKNRELLEELVHQRTRELEQSERRSRAILERTNTPIAIINTEGTYVYVNPKFTAFFGYSKEEIIGQNISLLSFAQDDDTFNKIIQQSIRASDENQGSFRFEFQAKKKNGQRVWIDLSIAVIFDERNQVCQLVGVHLDITGQRILLEELKDAKAHAESASRAKSEFLATMSHEMRTPLNGILGICDLLLSTQLGEKQAQYAQMIKGSGKSLHFLINEVLDFSKIEAGKMELIYEKFDLHDLVEAVLGIMAGQAAQKGLEICTSFTNAVPHILWGDCARVRQILLNLIGNAVKFTEEGGVRVHISTIFGDTSFLKITVSDTGVGIPENHMDRLFKLFSQADQSSSRNYGGTGLGLAISKKLVEMMGGEIGVSSEENKGSTFWFTLPIRKNEQGKNVWSCNSAKEKGEHSPSSDLHGQAEARNGETTQKFSSLRFPFDLLNRLAIVVDENSMQRETLVEQMENWGMQTVGATSGAEALEQIAAAYKARLPFEIAIIDNTLEDFNGHELLEKIRSRELSKNLPVILLSSITECPSRSLEADQDGFTCRIPKPVYSSYLFDAIMTLLFTDRQYEKREKATSDTSLVSREEVPDVRILVAEDNRINQVVVRGILESAGFHCDIVDNGRKVLDALAADTYDLVIMDCQMPELDGYQASLQIREREKLAAKQAGEVISMQNRIPIVALTANATKGDEEKCLASGMDAYCSKPIDPGILIGTIDFWLQKKRNPSR